MVRQLPFGTSLRSLELELRFGFGFGRVTRRRGVAYSYVAAVVQCGQLCPALCYSTRPDSMSANFSVREALPTDIPVVMNLVLSSFEYIPMDGLVGNVNTPEGRNAAGARHLQAWLDHANEYTTPCAIICVHTDPTTRVETIAGFAEWYI